MRSGPDRIGPSHGTTPGAAPRAEQVLLLARRSGRIAQLDGAVSTGLRRAAFRLVPPSWSLRMVERLTAWEPPRL